MTTHLNWGILGTGSIAKAFAQGLAQARHGKLVAVGSRSKEKAEAFAKEHNAPVAHGSYEALLADPKVDAVYISTPHPFHAELAIRAAEAKKHVLCEKPIGLNHPEAMAIVEAAIANDVFLMEAYMYRCHPQTRKLVELLQQKVIGDVRVIHATFSFHWPKPWNDTSRLTSNALGGGGILDVGGYTVSAARLVAGVAAGKPFLDSGEVKGVAHLGKTNVDEYACAVLKFPNEVLAQCSTGVQVQQDNALRIFGSEGSITVDTPWVPSRAGGTTHILLHRAGEKEPERIAVESPQQIYAIEADTVAQFVDQRQCPYMSWDDTLGNAKTLDLWRQSFNHQYESEKPARSTRTVSGRPLAVARPNNMKFGKVAGVDKPVSRLVMGVDNQPSYPHAAVMFDDFFSRGGNTFDTAHIYGGGRHEALLGQWHSARNVRDQIVIIAKGAHTPNCDPRSLTTQLKTSLERLQTDYADLYLMHRDNPDIPVGEFVDVLNEHLAAGRIKAFGGSNWSLARVDEANAYAKKHNLAGFAAVSNNFSLARMVDAIWAGCIHASDPASRAWFAKTQTPLFAWSSQARGFFLPGKAAPDKRDDPELSRCWYADDNFQRLDRVNEMAKKRNVLPINIALAYVLSQSFPTHALIGPRQLSETRTSFQALDIELTPEEVKWLNLEA